ncbi:carbohydrate ABC transporter permease [Brachyspira hampsonii]|uniref:Sugar ABC transporter permease n=1 Tax=Brachyspira hampsonii TaxID=1287055 RepID=A0AAC9TTS0_9SPIR|nr:sugar ABC transporter permease [Brachyspira hampsonii]ASJ20271.1 sugar ABC transporter permease [Brachyspira hampsonii]ELV07057.1 L-arabinose ABC transporter permease protein AraP [Brachyspira hampsonii 30599]OEJ16404.1 sugar ABC transporter permease [Brachyspira hampsonii]
MKKYSRRFGFYLSIPVIITLILFNFWPFIETIVLSFMTQRRGEFLFNGIKNYQRLFGDNIFRAAIVNSFIFYIIRLPIMLITSTLLGSIIHRGVKKLKSFFEASYFIPVLVDAVAYSMIFLLIFQDRGVINFVLSKFGIEAIPWLKQTIPAKLLIVIAVSWRWTGYNMILFLAAMQNIPEDYYEAATIDGANSWQKFLYVTLPSLKPIILFTTIMSTIGTLNLFEEPFLLTNGGPNNGTMTLGLYIYNQAFVSLNMTYAATISVLILIIVGTLTFLQLKLGDKKS